MKWIIGVLVVLGVAGGIYLQTQPRLDLRCVIAQGYDRLAKRHAGWRCLHHAAARGDVSVVISALRDGVPIDARTDSGGTPLMLAAANGRLPVIQILVMRQAGLDLTNANPGATALYSATRRRHPAAVRALLRLGASVDVPDDNGRTPLLLAATSTDASDTQIAHSLVAAGASVGSRDKAGNNGLCWRPEPATGRWRVI